MGMLGIQFYMAYVNYSEILVPLLPLEGNYSEFLVPLLPYYP